MSVKLSDLSEEDRAILLREAKEGLGDRTTDTIYSSQVVYLNQAISAFIHELEESETSVVFAKTAISDKIRPFISYLMKMLLVQRYDCPENCQSRAKTSEQLKDFEWITDEVFKIIYQVNNLEAK